MAELEGTTRRRRVENREQPEKTVSESQFYPRLMAEAGVEAFRKCRPAMEDFILEFENRMYSEGIISRVTHDIINDIPSSSIVRRRQLLLDAVESWLRQADSSAEFDAIVSIFKEEPARYNVADKLIEARKSWLKQADSSAEYDANIFKEDPAHHIVVDKLTEARGSCLSVILRKQSSRCRLNWIVPTFALAVFIIVTICVYHIGRENDSTRNLKHKYSTSNLTYIYMFGQSYTAAPYVDLSIFQYLDPDWKVASYKKQEHHNMASQLVSVNELLNVGTGDRILIIGGPGMGKTRLTFEVMRMWTKNKVLLSCELLLVYCLRWLKKDIDLKDLVAIHMEGDTVVDEVVNKAISTGGRELCFLFDGLDEYNSGYSDIDNYVFKLMHRQVLSDAVVIVTTRNITSIGFENMKWTRQYHITGFSNEQLKSYFQMQTGENITKFITAQSSLWQMCKIPLHVSLLVKAFSPNKINSTIFTTTELFTELTLKTFESDLSKETKAGKKTSIKDMNHLLEYSIFKNACALAFKGLMHTPKQYSFIDSEVPDTLKWTNLSYFQIEPHPGAWNMERYTFVHPSLMDFLAAIHLTSLSESEQESIITEYCQKLFRDHDDFWKFVCGLSRHFTSIYEILYRCSKSSSFTWKLMIFHCIFEAQSHSSLDEVQSAAHYHMRHERHGRLHLYIKTITAYDMQTLGFTLSSSPSDIKELTLTIDIVADGDYDLSFLFESLTKSGAIFSNLNRLHFYKVCGEVKVEEPIKAFLESTPSLSHMLLSDNTSESILQKLILFAPPSCEDIAVTNTHFDTNTGVTPHSLFKHCKPRKLVSVSNCRLRDEHLFDMQSTPWSVNTDGFSLSDNCISSDGAIFIAKSLAMKNKAAKTNQFSSVGPIMLDLSYNKIGVEGLVALLMAANTSSSRLELIDLIGNDIIDNNVKLLIKVCRSFSRQVPVKIYLAENKLTKEGEAKLKYISRRSQCHLHLELPEYYPRYHCPLCCE